MGVDLVTLLVGDQKVKTVVAKGLLCEVSSFFKAAFTSKFKETCDESIHLPEDTIETVEAFVGWLYTGQYSIDTSEQKEGQFYTQPINLLVFADKYDVPTLQRLLYKEMIEALGRATVSVHIKRASYVYNHTCNGSGMRMLLAEEYAPICDKDWLLNHQEWLLQTPELAVDMLVASAEMRESGVRNLVSTRKAEYYMEGRRVMRPDN